MNIIVKVLKFYKPTLNIHLKLWSTYRYLNNNCVISYLSVRNLKVIFSRHYTKYLLATSKNCTDRLKSGAPMILVALRSNRSRERNWSRGKYTQRWKHTHCEAQLAIYSFTSSWLARSTSLPCSTWRNPFLFCLRHFYWSLDIHTYIIVKCIYLCR